MEARSAIVALMLTLCFSAMSHAQRYQVNTDNFTIHAPSVQMARKAAHLAEQYRADLSKEWLGYEIPNWDERCPIIIEIGRHAGGETSFGFAGGSRDGSVKATPMGWQMKIFGPPDRVLDAVLPHEITHTIFATHFGRPLPRWADEGACTTVEHESERAKNHQMLIDFLTATPSRGIPFNRMFTMKQYPHDILPLYAQGYSLARFLIGQKGKRHFIKYIEAGLALERPAATLRGWDMVTDEFYGFEDLSELQVSWVSWVKDGCPDQAPAHEAIALANYESSSNPSPSSQPAETQGSWYASQMRSHQGSATAAQPTPIEAQLVTPTRNYAPGSVKAPVFQAPNVPTRQSATMSSKGSNTVWR